MLLSHDVNVQVAFRDEDHANLIVGFLDIAQVSSKRYWVLLQEFVAVVNYKQNGVLVAYSV